jgi:transcriptional regulator with XRE-family HTH domain
VNKEALKDKRGILSTEAMLVKLKSASSLGSFIEENRDEFLNENISRYLDALLVNHGITKTQAIERSGIERGYAYQILRGEKDASRDKYIRLAIGFGLTLEETQHLLTVAKHGVLYSKVLRDAIIIYGINSHLDIVSIGCLLEEKGTDPLG